MIFFVEKGNLQFSDSKKAMEGGSQKTQTFVTYYIAYKISWIIILKPLYISKRLEPLTRIDNRTDTNYIAPLSISWLEI